MAITNLQSCVVVTTREIRVQFFNLRTADHEDLSYMNIHICRCLPERRQIVTLGFNKDHHLSECIIFYLVRYLDNDDLINN